MHFLSEIFSAYMGLLRIAYVKWVITLANIPYFNFFG